MTQAYGWGVVGMGVMGKSLALNLVDRGERVVAWDRHPQVLETLAAAHPSPSLRPEPALEAFVGLLERPRRILLMVTAGPAVDAVLERLAPLLAPGDVVVDGGNSWFEDTERRERDWATKGLHFVGMGVSGGEEGARHGPSMMPGGSKEAWARMRPTLEAIAARTDTGPCVTHVGPGGAGHFVKMVHNGIEYADMQALAETYHLLRDGLGLDAGALADVLEDWGRGVAESFLLETTVRVLRKRDPEGPGFLVDQVLDRAGQKGTGKWTVQVALEHAVPVPSIAAALDARVLSSLKPERVAAARVLPGPMRGAAAVDRAWLQQAVHDALYAARICVYAQGMRLIQQVSEARGWGVDLAEVARIWRGGCIIRARLLTPLREALQAEPTLPNLMVSRALAPELERRAPGWRDAVAHAARAGVPVPVLGATLAYFDSYRSADLPQNLTQAQRDAFGAHTYERKDRPGVSVHTEWS